MFYKGKLLEDERELRTYNINEGSIINLEIRSTNKTQILNEKWTGKILKLQADNLDLMDKIKSKIKRQEGFLKAQQVLNFENKKLENDCKLSEYNIEEKNKLQIELASQEAVKMPEEDLFDPELDFNYTNVNANEKLLKKRGEFYSCPSGWKTLAFNDGKYENDDWLGFNNGNGEWAIANRWNNLNRLEDVCLNEFDAEKIKNLVDENGCLPYKSKILEFECSENGGYFKSSTLDLNIPKGSVENTTVFEINQISNYHLKYPPDIELLSPAFEFLPHSTIFKQPIQLFFHKDRFLKSSNENNIYLFKQEKDDFNDNIWSVYFLKNQDLKTVEF